LGILFFSFGIHKVLREVFFGALNVVCEDFLQKEGFIHLEFVSLDKDTISSDLLVGFNNQKIANNNVTLVYLKCFTVTNNQGTSFFLGLFDKLERSLTSPQGPGHDDNYKNRSNKDRTPVDDS
jgi:hypothetical protein